MQPGTEAISIETNSPFIKIDGDKKKKKAKKGKGKKGKDENGEAPLVVKKAKSTANPVTLSNKLINSADSAADKVLEKVEEGKADAERDESELANKENGGSKLDVTKTEKTEDLSEGKDEGKSKE